MEIKNIDLLRKINVSYVNQAEVPFHIHWARIATETSKQAQTFLEHSHDFFEALFLVEGKTVYSCNDNKIKIDKNQYAIFPPGTKHTLEGNSDSFVRLIVCFSIDSSSELYENFILKRRVLYDATEDMLGNIRQIIHYIENPGTFYEIVVSGRLEELVYLIIEDSIKNFSLKIKSDCPDVRLVQAKKYILDNPGRFFSCEEVASYCYLSRKQLGRLFNKYEHMSLQKFIYTKKLNDIMRLIKETNLTHTSISKKLGFASKQYYYAFFKKHMGITPEEYRLKHRDVLDLLE
ncbi:MAG: helix-turn-helix transcriptional regulator [Clostridia bacterium]|nr:helix-turn-helix transcriptional regulator [Clostridia bacterium]